MKNIKRIRGEHFKYAVNSKLSKVELI